MQIKDVKNQAKSAFAYNRYSALLHSGLVYALALNIAIITTVLAVINIWAIWYGIVLVLLFLLALMPYKFGMAGFYLRVFKYEKQDGLHLFDGMNRKNLERVLALYLIKFGIWLGLTILLIVPGVIFAIQTSMATYLLRANPKLSAKGALSSSAKIMKTHSLKYFRLSLSFAGWFLLGIVTFGIAFVWLSPYFNASKVVFYKRELQGDTTDYREAAKNAAKANAAGGEKEVPFLTQSFDSVDSIPYELTAFDESGETGVNRNDSAPILDDNSEPIAYTAEYIYEPTENESGIVIPDNPGIISETPRDFGNRQVNLNERSASTVRSAEPQRSASSMRSTEPQRSTTTVRGNEPQRSTATVRSAEPQRSASSIRSADVSRNGVSARGASTERTAPTARRSETERSATRNTDTVRRTDTDRNSIRHTESDRSQRRIAVEPLSGATVRMDENGRRTASVASRRSTVNTEDGGEGGESVREHLERLRADRMASRTDSRADKTESEDRNGETD